jgi:hypothetical protein
MNNKNINDNAFSQETWSSERVKELTMSKIDNSRAVEYSYAPRRARRGFASVAVAAVLVVTMLSAAAFAANIFGIADYFKSVFGNMSETQIEVLEELGKIDMPPVTSNGTTMTPLAAVGDDDFYYLMLQIEAPMGTVLDLPDDDVGYLQIFNPDESESMANIVSNDGSQAGIAGTQLTWIDEIPGDSMITLAIHCISQNSDGIKFNDGSQKTFRILGLWLQSPDKVYTKILDGVWEFNIGDFGASGYANLPVNGKKTVGDGGYEMTLQLLSVSPLGIRYEYTYPRNENVTPGPGVLQAILKDGTIIEATQADGNYTSTKAESHAYFSAPVKVSEIDYIQFGDLAIPIE